MTTFEVAQQIAEWGFLNRAFLFRDWDHVAKVMAGPIGEQYRKAVADKMGIVILASTYLGTRELNLRAKREVKGPVELKGVKLRMTGGPEWLLLGEALGVTPTPMAMPEVYLALKTGSIDGQENPLTIMNAAKFYEVTEQVVLTHHLVQPVFYSLRKETWDKMSADQKKVVQAAADVATAQNNEARLADERQVAERLKGRGLTVDAVDLKPFRDNADKVYAASDFAKAWNKELLEQAASAR
jgi:TRAP-type C4-dicarboxylate transport system substrate-binding protein